MKLPTPNTIWPTYRTPIQVEKLEPFLKSHPDAKFAAYIHEGLTHGFRIGYDHQHAKLRSRGLNHPSALVNKKIVDKHIACELAAGRLHGPLTPQQTASAQVSPLGLVPKPHQPNKFRLIVDLSYPEGYSVNDGIPTNLCSLKYASVDQAVSIIKQIGRDTQLVKLDIKEAYRIIPTHPAEYHLLGVTWKGKTYLDRALPFGLRSAPKIFSAVADFISWALYQHGVEHHLRYLDDFLLLGAPSSQKATEALATTMRAFHMLGIPIAHNKTEGPATSLSFLGILIDTHTFELRLPADKLLRLQDMVQQWTAKTYCTRKELKSLLGHLSQAATVIIQGRTFLRQLFHLLSLDRASYQFIRLNAGARADLLWWRTFLHDWNGTSFFPSLAPSVEVTSDASGSYGCGGFSLPYGWFQLKWPESWQSSNIASKEMVPIVIAAAIWGCQWTQSCVCFRSDNMAVISVLRSRTCKDQLLMHLLRCLIFYAAFFRFTFTAQHVPGSLNAAADAISRNNTSLFFSLVPQVPQATVPQPVIELLINNRPNWGSKGWTELFIRSLSRGLQHPREQSTNQAGNNT